MLKLRCNGVQALSLLLNHFRQIELFTTSSSTQASTCSFADYLVNTLGFTKQQSLSTSTKLTRARKGYGTKKVSEFNFSGNADLVVKFLKQIGLDQAQIKRAIFHGPRILLSDVDKTLKPKIRVLQELGLAGSDLANIVSMHSNMLIRKLSPAIEDFREILGSDENLVRVLKRSIMISLPTMPKLLAPNVVTLRDYGVPLEKIREGIARQPTCFLLRPELFRDVLSRVEKWGISKSSGMFLYGICLMASVSEESLASKCRVFESFGWTEGYIRELIRRYPRCLRLSEMKLQKCLEFYGNQLGHKPVYLVSRASLFTYSLEKRVIPRFKVLQALEEKGLFQRDYHLYNAVCLAESKFLGKFVQPFEGELPDLHEVYIKNMGTLVAQPKGKICKKFTWKSVSSEHTNL